MTNIFKSNWIRLLCSAIFYNSLAFVSNLSSSKLAKTGRQNVYVFYDTMQNFYSDAPDDIVLFVELKRVFYYDYIDKFEQINKTPFLFSKQLNNRRLVSTTPIRIMTLPSECWGTLSCSILATICDFICCCGVGIFYRCVLNVSVQLAILVSARSSVLHDVCKLKWNPLFKYIDRPFTWSLI